VNCFVVMPFESKFDDVYATIKATVETASRRSIRCSRLDETKPAGRITDRLLKELCATSICIVDLTGNNPNVMWEMGYAMALGKPLVVITQNISALPFDVREMQSLEYDRSHLRETLGHPLKRIVRDTIAAVQLESGGLHQEHANTELSKGQTLAPLVSQIEVLKDMIGQLVRAWVPNSPLSLETIKGEGKALSALVGIWVNPETGTHIYARMFNDQLVAPYCFGGNDKLTGFYYDWRRTGEYWFTRFRWFRKNISGFVFLRHESPDTLRGAWWHDDAVVEIPQGILKESGIPVKWERIRGGVVPLWAERFFEEPRRLGRISRLTRR
jgi:nucleoside 2-deoxyribosyltransferase